MTIAALAFGLPSTAVIKEATADDVVPEAKEEPAQTQAGQKRGFWDITDWDDDGWDPDPSVAFDDPTPAPTPHDHGHHHHKHHHHHTQAFGSGAGSAMLVQEQASTDDHLFAHG